MNRSFLLRKLLRLLLSVLLSDSFVFMNEPMLLLEGISMNFYFFSSLVRNKANSGTK